MEGRKRYDLFWNFVGRVPMTLSNNLNSSFVDLDGWQTHT